MSEAIQQIREGTPEFDPDAVGWPVQVHVPKGEGKVKKRITFYGRNQDTKIEELRLLEVATELASAVTGEAVSIEDFVRSAALQVAAQMVVREKQRQLAAEQAEASAALKQNEQQTEGVADAANSQQGDAHGMVGQEVKQAEVAAAGAGEAADGAAVE